MSSPEVPLGKKVPASSAFTLIEVLAATVLMLLLFMLLVTMVGKVSSTWTQTDARISSFQSARSAFVRMTHSLGQATLNPYWDYLDANGIRRTPENAATFEPVEYGRQSDQHFCILPASDFTNDGVGWACFFQAPHGSTGDVALNRLDNLLNTVGFFVEFNDDAEAATRSLKPNFIDTSKWRYRLMQLIEPAENLDVYTLPDREWIESAMGTERQARPVADNVIALVFQAKDNTGANLPAPGIYLYDSRDADSTASLHQLPQQVQVTMVAIDEASAARLADENGESAPDFGLEGLFTDPARFEEDLQTLETTLQSHPGRPNYRVFNTTVRIESALWSE